MTYFIVIWFVLCPVCGTEYNDTQEERWNTPKSDWVNFVECPKCHVALVAHPIKITKVSQEFDGVCEGGMAVKMRDIKEVIYEEE